MVNIADVAWTAGIVDGEGCIYARKNKEQYFTQLSVSMYDPSPIYRLKSIWGGSVRRSKDNRNNRRDSFVWVVAAKKMFNVLIQIQKHLSGKDDQARVAILLQDRITSGIGRAGGITNRVLLPGEKGIRDYLIRRLKDLKRISR